MQCRQEIEQQEAVKCIGQAVKNMESGIIIEAGMK
jgi:hypothetical protein